ncbi:hypothetical protein U1Q18_043936 [Sarracenia purpurea var. burkii]
MQQNTILPERSALATEMRAPSGGRGGRGRGRGEIWQCTYCGNPGHLRKTCWILHGRPAGRGGPTGGRFGDRRAHAAVSEADQTQSGIGTPTLSGDTSTVGDSIQISRSEYDTLIQSLAALQGTSTSSRATASIAQSGGFILGGRALSFALFKLGCSCSAGLALTVGFALKALLTGEGFTNMMAPEDTPSLETRMLPTGEGTSGAKCPLPSSEDSPVRSISTQGSSWIDRVFGGTGGEATSNPTNRGNLETSSPAVSQQGDFRGENEPQPSPPLPRVETPGISQLAEGAAAPPAPAPPAEAVPPAMAISQADYNAFRQLLSNHQRIQSSLLQLFRELRTHVPGGFQAERLTEMLEEEHGGDKMGEILMSLQTEGRQSPYFKEAHRDFQYFRNNKITEMSLRRQWQGRGAP